MCMMFSPISKIKLVLLTITVILLGDSYCQISRDEDVVFATTQQGKLRGKILKSRDSRDYFAFQGIPYAEVKGRFQAPEPPESWIGIRNATEFGSECPQISHFTEGILANSEDCLFLNVYIPDVKANSQRGLPILVWIHGGGFWEGAGSNYGADYFMDEQVILITFNYRLGVLGFLNTGDGQIPGNNGLRDMIMALKWVQENIQNFHGDPQHVTIFGESAGGFAVHYLMLSPAATGLFHGVISQSGTALSPLGFVADPATSNLLLAEQLGCPTFSTHKMVDCFKNEDVERLLSAQKNITFLGTAHINNRFAPSIDSNLRLLRTNEKPIVPTTPYELMKTRLTPNVPMIIGLTESEGIAGFAALYLVNQQLMNDLNANWLDISPDTFGYRSFVPEDKLAEFGSQLREIYMGSQNFSLDTEDSFVDMNSHYIMYRGTRLTAELTAQQNPNVYPYVFTHRGAFSFANYLGIYGRAPTHTDELQYQFSSISKFRAWPNLMQDTDIEFSKKFVKLWVSFAATGKPTETWGKDWKQANITSQPLGSELPWYCLNRKPKPFSYSQETEDKYVKMDTLYSLYEKPQKSWRADSSQKEEL